MEEKKYLDEEKYQKAEKSITLVAILVLVVGLCIGGFLIYKGVARPDASKIDGLKVQLETKKSELEAKGIRYSRFTKYSDGEAYDLKVITEALDPSFNHCDFDEYKSNSLTKEYCAAKNNSDDFASEESKMLGIFVCFAACMFSGAIFLIAKGRYVYAFQAQQGMPVTKEVVDEMAPTMGKAAGEIAKGVKKGLHDKK